MRGWSGGGGHTSFEISIGGACFFLPPAHADGSRTNIKLAASAAGPAPADENGSQISWSTPAPSASSSSSYRVCLRWPALVGEQRPSVDSRDTANTATRSCPCQ